MLSVTQTVPGWPEGRAESRWTSGGGSGHSQLSLLVPLGSPNLGHSINRASVNAPRRHEGVLWGGTALLRGQSGLAPLKAPASCHLSLPFGAFRSSLVLQRLGPGAEPSPPSPPSKPLPSASLTWSGPSPSARRPVSQCAGSPGGSCLHPSPAPRAASPALVPPHLPTAPPAYASLELFPLPAYGLQASWAVSESLCPRLCPEQDLAGPERGHVGSMVSS